MDAVKTWVFEPARRGEEAVTVWVTLPVRFKLQSGLGGRLMTTVERRARRAIGQSWRSASLCVPVGTGRVDAQSIWDDPAFHLLRQATDALNDKNFARAGELASQAIAQMPNHPLAYYVRGQAAAAQSKWDEAAAVVRQNGRALPGLVRRPA